jgi:hypothetical protein
MAIPGVITAQTGGRQFDAPDITKYSLFVGGVNATHHALANYSPLMNGFGRLFMVRPPKAILRMFAGNSANLYSSDNLFIQFKHILEYMNRSVSGFGEKTLEVAQTPIEGGFAGRSFRTPTVTRDNTTEVTISVYELSGSPIYTVIDAWMNAIGDENSGLATYGGLISGGKDQNNKETRLYRRSDEDPNEAFAYNEANHTAEFIYVLHDRSGSQVERAVLLADCYPLNLPQANVLDDTPGGAHDNVTYDLRFNCTVYRSPIITSIANDLLKQYRIVSNSLNFNPELGDAVYADGNTGLLNRALGEVPYDSATGTNVGNTPVYGQTAIAKEKVVEMKSMDEAKLAGQPGRRVSNTSNWDGFGN